jgi:hypothetical protein
MGVRSLALKSGRDRKRRLSPYKLFPVPQFLLQGIKLGIGGSGGAGRRSDSKGGCVDFQEQVPNAVSPGVMPGGKGSGPQAAVQGAGREETGQVRERQAVAIANSLPSVTMPPTMHEGLREI